MRFGKRYRVPQELFDHCTSVILQYGGQIEVVRRDASREYGMICVTFGESKLVVIPAVFHELHENGNRVDSDGAFLDVLYKKRERDEPGARTLESILLDHGAKVEPPFESFSTPFPGG